MAAGQAYVAGGRSAQVTALGGAHKQPKEVCGRMGEIRYLGYHLGGGQVHPQVDKTAAIAAYPRPKTKKEARQFMGLASSTGGSFVNLTSSLTDLTRKGASDAVKLTEPADV